MEREAALPSPHWSNGPRFIILVHLAGNRVAENLRDRLAEAMRPLPAHLRQSLKMQPPNKRPIFHSDRPPNRLKRAAEFSIITDTATPSSAPVADQVQPSTTCDGRWRGHLPPSRVGGPGSGIFTHLLSESAFLSRTGHARGRGSTPSPPNRKSKGQLRTQGPRYGHPRHSSLTRSSRAELGWLPMF